MASVDELMGFSETEDETLVIDNKLRTITIPKSLKHIGVESDDDVFRLNFKMPKQYGEFDLSKFTVRINYLNARKEGDVYEVEDAAIVDDHITFSWLVGRFALSYEGNVVFNVCLKLIEGSGASAVVLKEFNTTIASLKVLEGLETTQQVIQAYPDLVQTWQEELFGRFFGRIDATLTIPGQAADAAETGRRISTFTTEIDAQVDELKRSVATDVAGLSNDIHAETVARKSEIAVERARIDKLTSLPSGSTTGDAELADIRVDADGNSFENAGAAVRHQIKQTRGMALKNSIYDIDVVREHMGLVDLCAVDSIVGRITNDNKNKTWQYAYKTTPLPVGKYTVVVRDMALSGPGYFAIKASTTSHTYLQITEPGVYVMNVYDNEVDYNPEAVTLLLQMATDVTAAVGTYYVSGISIFEGDIKAETILPGNILGLDTKLDKHYGKNLFNKNDVTMGVFISGGGVETKNEYSDIFYASGYIPIQPNTTYALTDYLIGGAFVVFYNKTLSYVGRIGGSTSEDPTNLYETGGIFTTPEDAAYVRLSGNIENIDINQLEVGNQITPYEEYTEYQPSIQNKMNIDRILRRMNAPAYGSEIAEIDLMTSGDSLFIESPNAKNYKSIGFDAKVLSFGKIVISQGKTNPYCSAYILIDSEKVSVYGYTTAASLLEKFAHGLAIDNFISVNLDISHGSTAKLTISSASGLFVREIEWNGSNGDVMVESDGSILHGCTLTYYIDGLNKELWMFGDSYFDFWPQIIIDRGHSNFYLDGYSGRNSANALASLKKCLTYAIPKKIAWFMGMNDPDKGAVNSSWRSAYNELVQICTDNNIELILATVPNVPDRVHSYKNDVIKASGYRYIDICNAVGADDSLNWYEGLLGGDKTHPARGLGDVVIAAYVLNNLPEVRSPHGIQGETGPQGIQGEPGPLTFEDFTSEQLEQIRGPQGPRGETKSASIVIGSTEAGHTTAVCDILCEPGEFTAALQTAIDTLEEHGGEIKILEGVYFLDRVDVYASMPLTISGCGRGTVINVDGDFNMGDGICIRDITFDEYGDGQFDFGMGSIVENNVFRISSTIFCSGCVIRNNTFNMGDDGELHISGYGVSVINNTFDRCTAPGYVIRVGYGIAHSINNNKFICCYSGIDVSIDASSTSIQNNVFLGCDNTIIDKGNYTLIVGNIITDTPDTDLYEGCRTTRAITATGTNTLITNNNIVTPGSTNPLDVNGTNLVLVNNMVNGVLTNSNQ